MLLAKTVQARCSGAGFYPAFYILLAVLLSAVTACHQSEDKEQIKHTLDSVVAAVQSGNYGEIAAHLHNDFHANNEMDAQQVKERLLLAGMQHLALTITVVSSDTEIDTVYTDRATSTVSVVVTSGSSIAGLPADGSAHLVKLEWRKEGSEWKIFHAAWNE